MRQAPRSKKQGSVYDGGGSTASKQLLKEIHCLEKQLDRLRRVRGDMLDVVTLQTYEEMIVSRRQKLDVVC